MRVSITIEVNCDPVLGHFYDPEDWRRHFQNDLNRCPWYKPEITDFHVIGGERCAHRIVLTENCEICHKAWLEETWFNHTPDHLTDKSRGWSLERVIEWEEKEALDTMVEP
jgi:hypothetical protein